MPVNGVLTLSGGGESQFFARLPLTNLVESRDSDGVLGAAS